MRAKYKKNKKGRPKHFDNKEWEEIKKTESEIKEFLLSNNLIDNNIEGEKNA